MAVSYPRQARQIVELRKMIFHILGFADLEPLAEDLLLIMESRIRDGRPMSPHEEGLVQGILSARDRERAKRRGCNPNEDNRDKDILHLTRENNRLRAINARLRAGDK